MKKFPIILAAVATLLAGAACSKVVPAAGNLADEAVSFEVANFAHRTKANVAFDTGKTFTTYSWFYAQEEEEIQSFMNPATVGFRDGVWKAVNRPYYWPKTGHINFISFAGDRDGLRPDVTPPDADGVIVVSYGETQDQQVTEPVYVTIEDTDDPLLAEAAYHYSWKNGAERDDVSLNENDPGFTGVPTLFHHLVSKVTILIQVDASEASEGHSWKLKVNDASFDCVNEGMLRVEFEEPQPKDTPACVWPFADDGDIDPKWIPRNDEEGYAVMVTKEADSQEKEYVAGTRPEPIVLWDAVSVLPQQLYSGQSLALNLTLTNTYGESSTTETADIPVAFYAPSGGPNAFSNTLDVWKMGHHYVYTMTIIPNAALRFDPATVKWEVEDIPYPI